MTKDSKQPPAPPSAVREVAQTTGSTIIDLKSTYIDPDVELGPGTVIYPNTTILGRTTIGARSGRARLALAAKRRVSARVRPVPSTVTGA